MSINRVQLLAVLGPLGAYIETARTAVSDAHATILEADAGAEELWIALRNDAVQLERHYRELLARLLGDEQ